MDLFQNVIDWLVPFLCGGCATTLGVMAKWGRAIICGMRALLRADLNRIHREYVQAGKPVPIEVKDEADDVYAAYHALGGNGVGTHLHEEILAANAAAN